MKYGLMLVLLVIGCGVPSTDEEDSEETSLAPAETAVNEPADECILLDAGPVPKLSSAEFDTLSEASIPLFIAYMMDLDGPTALRHVYAVRSTAHQLVYHISAEIDAPGLEGDGDIGTWARTGELESGGLIQAVGGTRHMSRFVGQNDAFTMSDESARLSVDCVKATEEG